MLVHEGRDANIVTSAMSRCVHLNAVLWYCYYWYCMHQCIQYTEYSVAVSGVKYYLTFIAHHRVAR